MLILDEPTSVLTRNEADEVLGFVRRLVDKKELSVLLITHKFREVMEYCDEVTVLRRGRFAGSGRTASLDVSRMAEMMMGEPRMQKEVTRSSTSPGRPVLRIEDLRARGDNGLEVLHGVNLTVREGEIVGIAGVSGNGSASWSRSSRASAPRCRAGSQSMARPTFRPARCCGNTSSLLSRKSRSGMPP